MRKRTILLLLFGLTALGSTLGATLFARPAAAAEADSVRGRLVKVSAFDGRVERIRVRADGGESSYELDSGTVIRAAGREASPRDLQPGDTVAVRYRTDGERRVAVEIDIARG
jgi:hypothetical protein